MEPPEKSDAPLPYAPWAFGIGLALVIVIGGAAIFSAWDAYHWADLEQVVTPTAVGDAHYAKIPSKHGGALGLKYQGQPLAMLSEGKKHDAHLIMAGTDDSGYYSLYLPAPPESPLPTGHYYIKLGVNDYMEVAPQ